MTIFTKHQKHWTAKDLWTLFEMLEAGTSWRDISTTLGRHRPACYNKAQLYRQMRLITYHRDNSTLRSIPNYDRPTEE